jgi:DNA-binding response OmpR family regulator
MKLLIADDNPQITQILATYARKEGYDETKHRTLCFVFLSDST